MGQHSSKRSKSKYQGSSKRTSDSSQPFTILPSTTHHGTVLSILYNPILKILLSAGEDKVIKVTKFSTKTVIQELAGHENDVTYLEQIQNQFLLSGSRDKSIRIWKHNENEYQCSSVLSSAHEMVVTALTSNSSTQFLSGSRDNCIKLWDITTQSMQQQNRTERNLVTSLQWQPQETQCLQTSEDLHLRLWDTRNLTKEAHIATHATNNIQVHCCTNPWDPNYFATTSKGFDSVGCEVFLWDKRKFGRIVQTFYGHQQTVNMSCFISREEFVTVSNDKTIKIWNHASNCSSCTTSWSITDIPLCICALQRDELSNERYGFAVGGIPNFVLVHKDF